MKNVVFLFIVISFSALAQKKGGDLKSQLAPLIKASAVKDSVKRKQKVDAWWTSLRNSKSIPLIASDSVGFLYRGEASGVAWVGDFNGWGSQKNFYNKGKRIAGTDVWLLACWLPRDARFDYKIALNEKTAVLDPVNPLQQWAGVGGGTPNSELRMPEWKGNPELHRPVANNQGSIERGKIISSKILGYDVAYSVYLPYGSGQTKLPTGYFTDGWEYLKPELGDLPNILDNLIANKIIKPIAAVFIEPIEPGNPSHNRRMEEYSLNEKYLRFLTDELVPSLEKEYPLQPDRTSRAIIGTSLGGLTAAYLSFSRPDVFGKAGIQSPAFWYKQDIYNLCDKPGCSDIIISMTSGTVNDTSEGARKMQELWKKNVCNFHYRETTEGHSWGNWRNLIDDILVDLFGQ